MLKFFIFLVCKTSYTGLVIYFYRHYCGFYAKSVDPYQKLHFAASDQGLHFLPLSYCGMLDINVSIHHAFVNYCPIKQPYNYMQFSYFSNQLE